MPHVQTPSEDREAWPIPPEDCFSQKHPLSTPWLNNHKVGSIIGNRFQLLKQLGTGAYGIVYQAWDMSESRLCAVKSLNLKSADGRPQDPRALDFQHREVRTHWKVQSHPNIVSMHGIVYEHDCIYVVLEYCPEGDLFHNITDCHRYAGNDELVRSVFLQIIDAVDYCHQMDIYHRDLKPENILVSDNGHRVQLADFGLAIESKSSNDYGCGSTFYMSPECLGQFQLYPGQYDCAPNDVWSLGVILVNLTCGRNPWKEASIQDATYQAFLNDRRGFLKTILPITDELNDILSMVFESDPARRISLQDLKTQIIYCRRFTTLFEPSPPSSPVLSPGSDEFDSDLEFDSSSEAWSSRSTSPDLDPVSQVVAGDWVMINCPAEGWLPPGKTPGLATSIGDDSGLNTIWTPEHEVYQRWTPDSETSIAQCLVPAVHNIGSSDQLRTPEQTELRSLSSECASSPSPRPGHHTTSFASAVPLPPLPISSTTTTATEKSNELAAPEHTQYKPPGMSVRASCDRSPCARYWARFLINREREIIRAELGREACEY